MHGSLDFLGHLRRVDQFFAAGMATALGEGLVFNVDAHHAGLLKMPHRLRDGHCIAVAGVRIRHHRNIHRLGQLATSLHVFEHGHHAQVFRHAKAGIEQARATGRRSLVTHLLHQKDAVTVIHPGGDADLGVANQGTHALCFAHHLKLLNKATSLQQRLARSKGRVDFFQTAPPAVDAAWPQVKGRYAVPEQAHESITGLCHLPACAVQGREQIRQSVMVDLMHQSQQAP